MKDNTGLHIALAADSNYIIPTTVVLQSIFDCHPQTRVTIYLLFLENTLQKKDLDFFTAFTEERNLRFIPLEVKQNQLAKFPETRHGKAALLRLCLPELLSQLDKILYMDGDIVVQDSLMDLYRTDISSYLIAAAKDTESIYHPDRIRALDINTDSHCYFNTGVVLLNLDKLRTINLFKEATEFVSAHYDIITSPDQDFFNYICQGRTLYIHPRYNMNYNVEKDIAWQTWGKDAVKEAKSSPAIIHYIGSVKPWSVLCVHPQRKRWWRVLKRTTFRNYTLPNANIKNKLRKCYLLITKAIEKQFTLEGKRKIGKLIPSFFKKGLKKSMLK